MKICYIGDGKSVHNHFMIDWFQKRGHQLLFLTDTPEYSPNCEVKQVAPHQGWGPFRHLIAAWKTRRFIKKWKPDIVHAHNVTGYGYWGALSGFSPLVVTSWGTDLNLIPSTSKNVYSWILYTLKKADLITADAEALCNTARTFAGKEADIRLLQWGVDLSDFNRIVGIDILRRYRGTADIVFISNRRLRPLYNIDKIIKAFSIVLSNGPKCRLLVIGEDEEKQNLHDLVRGLGIQDHVYFTGWLERIDLIQSLLCSDVFISIPSSDSTALSLLEAFSAKLPVIVTDLPANREWIEDRKNGFLIDPENLQMIADSMLELAFDPVRRKRWGEHNRTIVEEKGNRNIEMKRLETWYRELLEKDL
jgi:glycosyltransferase involved in cell wall biosynthesis